MKVLMFGWEFPPNISGGLGVATHGIVQGLLDHQIQVTLVLPNLPKLEFVSSHSIEFEIIQTPFNYSVLSSYHKVINTELISALEQYAKTAGSFAKLISHDVIHAHDWLTILAGIEAKRMSQKPLIFHIHSLEVERCAKPVNQFIYDIEKYGMDQADCIITVSEFTKQNIIRNYNIPAEKISVVHNGIFQNQIREHSQKRVTPPNLKTILFLARVTYQKAPFHFVEAARKVLQHRNDVQFVIAGDGDLFPSVVERVAELGLGTHIHFTRFLNRREVEHIYEMSHIYVMPSIAEPFGLTCLEALAQHVPVILSKQSGVSEVIQNTLKVDFWDIDEMASQMNALLDYPALHQQIVENSLVELHKLLWQNTAKKILNIYESIQ